MNEVIQNKVATIEKCVLRIESEMSHDWKNNYTHQDALLLNLERACQATIDAANHIIKTKKLGLPKQNRESFDLLQQGEIIDESLASEMKKMVGFRNIAVHDYSSLNLQVVENVLRTKLIYFKLFCESLIAIPL